MLLHIENVMVAAAVATAAEAGPAEGPSAVEPR